MPSAVTEPSGVIGVRRAKLTWSELPPARQLVRRTTSSSIALSTAHLWSPSAGSTSRAWSKASRTGLGHFMTASDQSLLLVADLRLVAQERLDEVVDLAVEDGPYLRGLLVGARVLDQSVRLHDVVADLVAPGNLAL